MPDPENWTAIGTMVIAASAVVGLVFGLRTLEALREEGLQNARQTAALVEQAWPHLEVVTDEIPLLHKDHDRWWGNIRHVFGTTPARDVEIWLREPAGHYFVSLNLVLPGTSVQFALPVATGELVNGNPFPVLEEQPLPGQGWIGIVWRCPDEDFRYELVAFTFDAQNDLSLAYPNRRDPGFRRRLSGGTRRR